MLSGGLKREHWPEIVLNIQYYNKEEEYYNETSGRRKPNLAPKSVSYPHKYTTVRPPDNSNLQSRTNCLKQSKEIEQTWATPENFNIYFCLFFELMLPKFYFGRRTWNCALFFHLILDLHNVY